MDKSSKTIIGKDVIESLTSGMYDNSLFIYREYIQNAADQIDKARQQGLVEDGAIYITIDEEKKIISIEDDATGIEKNRVIEILKSIAQSTKERGVDKGFRGIGRLGGLGYCEKLLFETSFQGEDIKSILVWDAKKLKAIINDRSQKEEASTVIDSVTSLEICGEDIDKHYFKVSLIGVVNKDLLDVEKVRTYLSMIAPVPFRKSFLFASKIYDELKKDGITIDEYKTFINTEQLFKGYNSYIYQGDISNKKKIDEVIDVLFFKEFDEQNNKLFWGWYGITEKNQSLSQVNFARGFRLRKANIQIGNEDTLTKLHKDKRFQFYFFGEVYCLHHDLIPNARRDYFLEIELFYDFEKKLKSFFHTTIHKFCYAASEINSAAKKIESCNKVVVEFEKKKKEGFVDKIEQQELLQDLKKKKEEAEKAEKKLRRIKAESKEIGLFTPMSRIIERATLNHTLKLNNETEIVEETKTIFRTDKLSKLNKEERKFLGNIFGIIQNVLSKEMAELLILKIEEKYK